MFPDPAGGRYHTRALVEYLDPNTGKTRWHTMFFSTSRAFGKSIPSEAMDDLLEQINRYPAKMGGQPIQAEDIVGFTIESVIQRY